MLLWPLLVAVVVGAHGAEGLVAPAAAETAQELILVWEEAPLLVVQEDLVL